MARVIRIPRTSGAAFVAAVGQARAAAATDGEALLVDPGGQSLYLLHEPPDRWRTAAATLFEPPAWGDDVLRIILRHGAHP